jgi:DNA polymerase-3 subunit gamma/tau
VKDDAMPADATSPRQKRAKSGPAAKQAPAGQAAGEAAEQQTREPAAGEAPAQQTPADQPPARKRAARKAQAQQPAGQEPSRRQVPPLALYRRYRPASFAEVKGQDHVTEPLRQALRSGRVHHAYLFSGPRGCGKTSSARILARSLNCEQGPTPDPCGVCASCVALAPAGPGSIDVIEIDAASHGGVDDARDLRERAFYAPVASRFKIYIIDEAHMVTGGGFNALLKLVEEPPPHLKFVFATTEPEKVIATIRSRTHHYPFRLVPPAVLREHLEDILSREGIGYEPAVLPVVIRAGAGSVRDSLSVLDQLIAGAGEAGLTYERAVALLGYTDDALLDQVTDAFAAGDGAAVFRAVDNVVEAGHDPRRFAADLLDRFRDLIVLAAVPDAGTSGLLDAPADRLERMREQAARFGQGQLVGAAETISAGLVEMRGATSPRLLLELMCAQVLLPAPDQGSQALLARLEQLERRLAGPAAPAAAAGQSAQAAPMPGAGRPTAPGPAQAPGSDNGSAGRPALAGHPASAARAASDRAAAGRAGTSGRPAQPAGDDRSSGAGPRSGEAGPADGPAGPAAAAGSAARPAAGTASAEIIRAQWPALLEAVKGKRRVAWLLLSNARVDSLDSGVLTLRFAREGEARGFGISGYDRDLGQVLQSMLGVTLQIRAIAGGPEGGGPQGWPDDPPAGRGPRGGPADGGRQDGGEQPAGPSQGSGQRGGAQPGAGQPGGPQRGGTQHRQHGDTQQGDVQRGDAQRGSTAQRQPQDRHAAGAPYERGGPPGEALGATAGTGRASARAAAQPGGPRAVARLADEPDLADPADADALTGIDLIERELGGRLIAETGEA